MAELNGVITEADRGFIESVFPQALTAEGTRPNTFVHGDYKLNNLTVEQDQQGWRVAGIFDLHEAMADQFVRSYLEFVELGESVNRLMPLYVVNDRMKSWEYFSRPEASAKWQEGKTFREWSSRYVRAVLEVLERVGARG